MKIHKYKNYIIVTFLATIIFLLFLKLNNIHPFGDISLSRTDSFAQYQPLLFNFIASIKNHTLYSYSFNIGLGTPLAFTYIYYLASPLNIIALLFNNINDMCFVLTLIRIILTSIFAKFYLSKKIENEPISNIAALTYTFSGWLATYYDQYIWLDIFMIFPLFQYSLEKLIKEKKIYLYIFTLSYMLISNFFLTFSICIYTLIYFFVYEFNNKDVYINKLKSFWRIAASTIISFLLCAFHIYLTYTSFLKRGILSNLEVWEYEMNIFEYLRSFLPGTSYLSALNYGLNTPSIYISTFFLINFIYFFTNKNITIKNKIKVFILFLVLSFIFFSKYANYIINGFHIPNGFNYRYSFIFSMIILVISVINLKNIDDKKTLKYLIISSLLLISTIIFKCFKLINTATLILNICSILCYIIILVLLDNNKFQKYFLYFCIPLELLIAMNISFNNYYETESHDYKKLNYSIKDFKNIQKNRILTKNIDYIAKNDNVISFHSSMIYLNTLHTLKQFGFQTNLLSGIYATNTNTINKMIFNIQNDYYLPKVFAVNKDILKIQPAKNSVERQNNFISSATNIDNILEEIPYQTIDDYYYEYHITEDGEYTILLIDQLDTITINNINRNELQYHDSLTSYNFKKGDIIKIKPTHIKSHPIIIYKLNKDKLNTVYEQFKNNQINYTSYTDSLIEGTINVEDNQIIFTSIPYDDNWHVFIDDNEANTIEVLNSLLAIECPPGSHKIRLEYKPRYIVPIIISIVTLMGLITSYIILNKKDNHS